MNVGDHQLPITSDDVADAARRLSGVANRTPVFTSRELNERVEAELFLRAEQFQRGGAFKSTPTSWPPPSPRARLVEADAGGAHACAGGDPPDRQQWLIHGA
jgi:threo-3-hydroxy-L-aspartate ammonia-lyase